MKSIEILSCVGACGLALLLGCSSGEKRSTASAEGLSSEDMGDRLPKSMVEMQLQPIYFDFDKFDIRSDGRLTLNQHVTFLKSNGKTDVQIEGHCDERGTEEYNIALGERRSLAVKKYLEAMGIEGTRVTFISYGEDRPADARHTEASWSLNRRAEFVLYK